MVLLLMPILAKLVVTFDIKSCLVLAGVSHTLVTLFSLKVESAGPFNVDFSLNFGVAVGLVHLPGTGVAAPESSSERGISNGLRLMLRRVGSVCSLCQHQF